MAKGTQKSVYLNTEVEEKALKICEKEEISLSKLINRAIAEYVAKRETEDRQCQKGFIG